MGNLLITPPFQAPDEATHLMRAFQLSEGHLLGEKVENKTGGFLPKIIVDDVLLFNHLPFHSGNHTSTTEWKRIFQQSGILNELNLNDRKFGCFSNTARYSPIPYLPQIVGMKLGTVAQLRTVTTSYLCRFLNLSCSMIILFFTLHLLSFSSRFLWTAFLLAGMPMTVFQMASSSADSMTNALALLTAALCLRLKYQPKNSLYYALLAASFLLSCCKQIYLVIPLAGLPFILKDFQIQKRQSTLKAFSLIFVSLFPMLLWTGIMSPTLSLARLDIPIDPKLQWDFIIQHPRAVISLFAETLSDSFDLIKVSFVGNLGWLDTPLHARVVQYYLLSLCVVSCVGLALEKKKEQFRWECLAWNSLLLMAFLLVLCLGLYLDWCPVGAPRLDGVQGRYFIGVAALFFLWLPQVVSLKEISYRAFTGVFSVGWLYCALRTLATLSQRYWRL